MTASITGGYQSLTLTQLCNVLTAVDHNKMNYRAVRVFFAVVSQLATRNAAQRAIGKRTPVRFELSELQTLTGKRKQYVRRALTDLKQAQLLRFSASEIVLNPEPIDGAQALLLDAVGKGRSVNRLVPLPRRIIRYLAQCSLPSVTKALIAYMIRGLSKRRDGRINNRGSVKSNWIAKIAGISLRAAKAARRVLITMGLLSEDTDSTQRKLNRTGAYFEINIDWPGETQAPESAPQPAETKEACTKFSPPAVGICTKFSPPNQRRTTPSENKNQKPQSGASKKQSLGSPNLNNIQADDLKRMSRLLKLYEQAVAQGWLGASEANLLFFIASAIRVKRTPCQDPIRAFIAIIRNDLRAHITQAQEDAARTYLASYRQQLDSATIISSNNQNDNSTQGLKSVKEILSKMLDGVSESLDIQPQGS